MKRCEFCKVEFPDGNKYAIYNHKRRGSCAEFYQQQDKMMKKRVADNDDSSTSSKKGSGKKVRVQEPELLDNEVEKHFHATLPTLINMVAKNDHDPSCLSFTLKSDNLFRDNVLDVEDIAQKQSKEIQHLVTSCMHQIKLIGEENKNNTDLVEFINQCYLKNKHNEKSAGFNWTVSNEKLLEDLEFSRNSIKVIENILKIRELAPQQIACKYIAENVEKLNREANNGKFVAPASASQLF